MKEAHQLFDSFPKPAKPEWTKAASAEISGADPAENLRWTSPDEQAFAAYYSAEDVAAGAHAERYQLNGTAHNATDARTWANMPEVIVHDEQIANDIALGHLGQEADGILFSTQGTSLNFTKLLNTIAWEHCAVSFLAGARFPVTELINYISDKNYRYEKLQGNLFWKDGIAIPPALPSHNGFRFAGRSIDATTPVGEVADALTKGVETIETFLSAGHKIGEVVRHIAFAIPVGPQLLLEISKLKALRMLWFQVVRSYGIDDSGPGDMFIHAISEPWIHEKFQPHGNMLKGTVAAIAAISGGANGLTVRPEDPEQPVMNRIARNTSVILKAESQLARVNDPFAGAYSVEVMTDRIARDAWTRFQARN